MKTKYRIQVYECIIFFLVLIASGLFFFLTNRENNKNILTGYRNTVFLVTQKEVEATYEKFIKNNQFDFDRFHQEKLDEFLLSIKETYPFFSNIELVQEPLNSLDHYFLIYFEINRLYFYFRIYNGKESSLLEEKYIKMEFDIQQLFKDLRINDKFTITDDDSGNLFLYGLKVKSVSPSISLTQITVILAYGFVIMFAIRRFTNRYRSFFYNSEGLEKIIYLFERAEEYSANHSRNVAEISYYIGKKMHFRKRRLKDLKVAAFLHDIGKISIPVEILNKNGSLSKDEFGEIKKHVIFSAEIIENFESLQHLKEFIFYHHEKMDGSGYPEGLCGDQIPSESRIISVADIFEALVGQRPYRAPVEREEAIQIMTNMPIDKEILSLLAANLEEVCKLITYKKGIPNQKAMIV